MKNDVFLKIIWTKRNDCGHKTKQLRLADVRRKIANFCWKTNPEKELIKKQ